MLQNFIIACTVFPINTTVPAVLRALCFPSTLQCSQCCVHCVSHEHYSARSAVCTASHINTTVPAVLCVLRLPSTLECPQCCVYCVSHQHYSARSATCTVSIIFNLQADAVHDPSLYSAWPISVQCKTSLSAVNGPSQCSAWLISVQCMTPFCAVHHPSLYSAWPLSVQCMTPLIGLMQLEISFPQTRLVVRPLTATPAVGVTTQFVITPAQQHISCSIYYQRALSCWYSTK